MAKNCREHQLSFGGGMVWWQRGAGREEAEGTASATPVHAPEAQPAHRSKQQALDACREQHGKLIRCLTSASWSSFNGAWYCPRDRA